MRLLMINLLAAALVLFSATFASAYELRLIATTPTLDLLQGDIVSYDLYLDTQGESNIILFSASLTYDPTVVTYRTDLSDAEDYYPLYAPGVGKNPGTWLSPVADPPGTWPAPPAGLSQINVDFIETNLNQTTGTATNLYLATLSFEVNAGAAPGAASPMNWSFDNGGNIFNVNNVDVSGGVTMPNTGPLVTVLVPEPTTALLVGLGLVGLGVAGRRRA